jgi:hypothetical protein
MTLAERLSEYVRAASPHLIARGWFTKRVSRGENF